MIPTDSAAEQHPGKAAQHRRYARNNPLLAMAHERGMDLTILSRRLGLNFSSGLAPSSLSKTSIESPLFAKLAKALSVSIDDLRPMSREGTGGKTSYQLSKARKHKGRRRAKPVSAYEESQDDYAERTQAVVDRRKFAQRGPAPKALVRAGQMLNGNGNGNGHRPRALGRLNQAPKEVRETIAAYVNTVNTCVMKGEASAPPIPIKYVRTMLQYFLDEMGVKIQVMLDPAYYDALGGAPPA